MHDTYRISGPIFDGLGTVHSAGILLQQLDMHLGDVQMDFLCKKPNHDRHLSKRLPMFQLSHVLPRCVCSLKGPCLEIPGCSKAYINSGITWAPAWIAGALQKWCFYCVLAVERLKNCHVYKPYRADTVPMINNKIWRANMPPSLVLYKFMLVTRNVLLNCVNYDVSIHSQQGIYI